MADENAHSPADLIGRFAVTGPAEAAPELDVLRARSSQAGPCDRLDLT